MAEISSLSVREKLILYMNTYIWNLERWCWGALREDQEWTYVYLWLIHVDVWQKPTQYCKEIILQLKINKLNMNLKPKQKEIALPGKASNYVISLVQTIDKSPWEVIFQLWGCVLLNSATGNCPRFCFDQEICALWDLLLFSRYITARPVANSALPPLLRDIAGAGIKSKQLE